MRKIRIGNDIAVQWSLVAKGTGEPFVVEGKDIRLSLKSIFAKTAINEFDVAGNTISWTFKGAEQKQVGIYSLEVSLLDEQGVMITTDVCDFVELVACSCEIGGMDATGVHTESIELVSDVDVAAGIDLSKYLTKTEAQTTYQPQEKGKGLSTNDYTNAEKNKLAGLQNYDDTEIKSQLTELSETFGVFLVLEKGGLSGGKPVDANLDIRCRTQLMNIGGDVSVTLNEGYALYYYIYKLDGSGVLFNENVNTELELKGYQGHLIRFVFRKVDNSPISVSDNIVKSLLGVYDLAHTRLDEAEQNVEALEQNVEALEQNVEALEQNVEALEQSSIIKESTTENVDEISIETNEGEKAGSIVTMTEETYASEQRWESNDGSELYAKIDAYGIDGKVSRVSPAISIPAVVEPSDDIVDEGYSSPIGRNNVIRANWSAENKYTYYDFLAHYYDGYVGKSDGYSVTKKSLGSDASNSGYELFEYDFCPLSYKKVVMLSAGMNTCETGALWGLATFIKAMMTSDEEGFKFLRENVRFKVLPMICPSSFDKDTLAYPNANGVRINKNFDYRRMWYDVPETNKGEYPDSEVESRILKAWLNENAWNADLYIDCHQDPDKNTSQANDLTIVICSDSATNKKLKVCFPALVQFYRNKGYIPANITPNTHSWVETGTNYPKTKYAKEICGIPSLMIEQYCSSTMYGSDGNTINDAAGIKNYATMLRLYTFAILQGEQSANSCWLSSLIH